MGIKFKNLDYKKSLQSLNKAIKEATTISKSLKLIPLGKQFKGKDYQIGKNLMSYEDINKEVEKANDHLKIMEKNGKELSVSLKKDLNHIKKTLDTENFKKGWLILASSNEISSIKKKEVIEALNNQNVKRKIEEIKKLLKEKEIDPDSGDVREKTFSKTIDKITEEYKRQMETIGNMPDSIKDKNETDKDDRYILNQNALFELIESAKKNKKDDISKKVGNTFTSIKNVIKSIYNKRGNMKKEAQTATKTELEFVNELNNKLADLTEAYNAAHEDANKKPKKAKKTKSQ